MKTIKPIFKSYEGRANIGKWILQHFPENYQNMCYLEPYCGGATLLFLKEKSLTEVINDIDLNIISIYQSLRNEPKEFIKRLNHYKYCEDTFDKIKSKKNQEDYLEQSIYEYILKKMSKSELKNKFSNINQSNWKKSIQDLSKISSRLEEVFIFNKKAIDIISKFNSKNCLLYCDPPFLYENKTSKKVYSSEMEVEDHIKLSHLLNSFKGKVIISGVNSPLYNRLYKNWNMFKYKNKIKGKKPEIIWKNF
jgi:DNA adenine methylase